MVQDRNQARGYLYSNPIACHLKAASNKSRIDNVLQTQTQQKDEIKAVRDITNLSKTRFDRIDDSINGINSTLISNKNTLKSLDG